MYKNTNRSTVKFVMAICMLILNVLFLFFVGLLEPIHISNIKAILRSQNGISMVFNEENLNDPNTIDKWFEFSKSASACCLAKSAYNVIAFFNIICIIIYVILSLPHYFTIVDVTGTTVKRLLKINTTHLFVVVYQYVVLLMSWSLVGMWGFFRIIKINIGNKLFGILQSHFKSLGYTIKYILVLGFNKALLDYRHEWWLDPIWLYNRTTIVVFYNIAATLFIALVYYSSKPPKIYKSTLLLVDGEDNMVNLNINATMQDMMRFKVFSD